MKKLTNKKGFTLMEMLIVVAIIVILVAVAVPSFKSSINKANEATDGANLKTAKSEAMLKAIDVENRGKTYYYNLSVGELTESTDFPSDVKPYAGRCQKHVAAAIKVVIAADGTVTVNWTTTGTDDVACGAN